MQSHHQSMVRSGSPGADIHNHPHIHPQDSIFNHQNGMYSDNTMNSLPEFGSDPDSRKFQPQHQHKLESFPSGYRGTFGSFPNTNRSRPQIPRSVLTSSNSYRDASFYPTTASEVFPGHLTSPVQPHAQPYESRTSYDFGGGAQGGMNGKPFNDLYNQSAGIIQAQANGNKHQHQQPAQHGAYQAPYTGGLHLSSQTPYGPHVPAGPQSAGTGANNGGGPAAPPGLAPAANTAGPNPNSEEISTIFVVGFPEDMQEREFQNMFTFSPGFEAATLKIPNKEYTAYSGVISNNGLRSAISNTFGNYGGPNDPYNLVTVNQGGVVVDAGRDGTMTSWPASVANDEVAGPHFLGGSGLGGAGVTMNMPRKQIIGFAKFRTREEALCARDVLQGRRVDIDKGAVLKAEMAKKNLHTKRGVGPIPGSGAGPSGTGGGSGGGGGGGGGGGSGGQNLGGLQQASGMNGLGLGIGGADQYIPAGNSESVGSRERDLGALGAMGLGSGRLSQWRDQIPQPQDHLSMSGQSGLLNGRTTPGREQEDDRRAATLTGMGLVGLGSGTRGPRERLEDDDRERRRKEMRLRAGNSTAFDAFHSVPAGSSARHLSNHAGGGLMSPVDGGYVNGISPVMGNGYGSSQSQPQHHFEEVGPWDNVRSNQPRSSRRSPSPPIGTVGSAFLDGVPQQFTSQHHLHYLDSHQQEQQRHDHHPVGHPPAQSESSSSSVAEGSQRGGGESDGSGVDGEVSRALGGLDVSTDDGKTSPQLPSPASGASSRNGVDQNPPINTLYVGNLPTSPPPSGFPQDYLEESLRELFSSQSGFRRLCFRQKSNGPMCFVEFDDVQFATRALNDLYGNTLKGLVKGGIRLSYSKNPLGVRTPTSASSNSSMQQQLLQGNNNNGTTPNGSGTYPSTSAMEFHPRLTEEHQPRTFNILRREAGVTSPPLPPAHGIAPSFNNGFLASPPPRFFSSSPSAGSFGPSSGSTSLTSTSNAFMPRNAGNMNMSMFGYTLPSSANSNLPSSTFSPFGPSSTPPPHTMIPETSDEQPHSQHFIHRALSPSTNNLEAARAS